MPDILVTTDPVSVAAALGIPDNPGPGAVVFAGSAQNVSAQETVYRLRSAVKPSRGAVAFRHESGDRWRMNVYSDEPTWLWTAQGSAAVVLQFGGEE